MNVVCVDFEGWPIAGRQEIVTVRGGKFVGQIGRSQCLSSIKP